MHFDLALGLPLDGGWSRLSTLDVVGIALFVPLVAADYYSFLRGWWLNFTIPAWPSAPTFCSFRSTARCSRKRKTSCAIRVGQYLSPEVIRRLLVNPQLVEPKKTDITVMFSDIRDSPPFRKLDARTWPFLNQYLSDMTASFSNTTAPSTNTRRRGDGLLGRTVRRTGACGRACYTR